MCSLTVTWLPRWERWTWQTTRAWSWKISRRQRLALDLLKQLPAGFADVAHRLVVQALGQIGDGGIEIGQIEEPSMTQPR